MKRLSFQHILGIVVLLSMPVILLACGGPTTTSPTGAVVGNNLVPYPTFPSGPVIGNNLVPSAPQRPPDIMKKPLVTSIYTADPSAHVFNGKLYIYPSHDRDSNVAPDNNGSQYDMVDYHVFSMDNLQTPPTDLGEVLNVKDVPWAEKQMWAPDAAFKDGLYYLYFPAKDKTGIFRIGVATSESPAGPFKAQAEPVQGSFSIDPTVFVDEDGQAYMYFGGLWGGQLEKWKSGTYDPNCQEPGNDQPALGPRVARLSADMLHFDGSVGEVSIVDEKGNPVLAGDHERRFFDASWMHKYNGTYYFSYSTGDTHFMAYATGSSPLGPFTFRGYVLSPVQGWTTHGSIVQFDNCQAFLCKRH